MLGWTCFERHHLSEVPPILLAAARSRGSFASKQSYTSTSKGLCSDTIVVSMLSLSFWMDYPWNGSCGGHVFDVAKAGLSYFALSKLHLLSLLRKHAQPGL